MATAEEVLAMMKEETQEDVVWETIGSYETKSIYVDEQEVYIDDREMGGILGQISVQGEKMSQYIVFNMPRYYDGVDISDMLLQVHYEQQNGTNGGEDRPVNVKRSDDRVKLGWAVPYNATRFGKDVVVFVYAVGLLPGGEEYIMKIKPKVYAVAQCPEIGGTLDIPDNSWYEQFVRDMDGKVRQAETYSDNAKASQDAAKESETAAQRAASTAQEANSRVEDAATKVEQQVNNINTKSTEVQQSINDLSEKIVEAETAKSNLDGSIKSSETAKSNLDSMIKSAQTLGTEINTAVRNAATAAENANSAASSAAAAASRADTATDAANRASADTREVADNVNAAEVSRANAENERASSENERREDERQRVANENTRNQNEETRNTQETKRQEDTQAAINAAKEATEVLINQVNSIGLAINEDDRGLDVIIFSQV